MPRLAKAAAAFLGGWGLWRLFGPRLPPRFEGVQSRPPGPPGRSVVVGRHEFFVREAGSAPHTPVLLLHGWAYPSLAMWHRVLPYLAERRRVFMLDLRGHGKSDRIRGRFEIADLADDVASVLDAVGVGRVAVVGYSMGGMTAQELARRHPARVERLVLAATAAKPVWTPRLPTAAVFIMGRALARLDPLSVPWVVHRYLLSVGAVEPQHSAWLWQELLDRDIDLYYESAFAINRFDARPWVGSIEAPVRCIVPTRDQLISPSLQRSTAASIPGAEVVELVGGRHEAVLTHADEMAAAILSFLA
jgi:3-oxoadipate enol-lactonase